MYGPKPMLIACALLLIAGSLLAASTSSLMPLIVGRGLQGFGIPIIPLGISVLRACVPAERVGSAMGLMSASLGVGGALGLPLSAVIAQHYDWHVLFWFADRARRRGPGDVRVAGAARTAARRRTGSIRWARCCWRAGW